MPEGDPVPLDIEVAAVVAMQNNGDDFLLLDVRESDEYELAKIAGSVLLPMSELRDRIEELDAHRERHIVVHCHHGGRSARVTQYLRDSGFQNVQNMAGGIDQWSRDIDPSVPRY